MNKRQTTSRGYTKAAGIGVATAVILSCIMVPADMLGIAPMPKPPSLAFAQLLLGAVPLDVGLLFHLIYVTFWSVVYIVGFTRHTFLNALLLALALWVIVLIFFFPIVGWGFLGLAVTPKLVVGSLIPHLLFAVVLWALCHWTLTASPRTHR